jgi:hypothetical protein
MDANRFYEVYEKSGNVVHAKGWFRDIHNANLFCNALKKEGIGDAYYVRTIHGHEETDVVKDTDQVTWRVVLVRF